jgi:hypothetical protein
MRGRAPKNNPPPSRANPPQGPKGSAAPSGAGNEGFIPPEKAACPEGDPAVFMGLFCRLHSSRLKGSRSNSNACSKLAEAVLDKCIGPVYFSDQDAGIL